jgi:hypothetical protein
MVLSNNEQRKGAALRYLIEKDMTPSQIAEAQKLAREWMLKHP